MTRTDRIPTNLRTLLILEILGKSDEPLTATQINAQLGLPKQTVHRLCATLEETGFLTRPGNTKSYQVARRLRDLGVGLIHNSRDHIARRQILLDLGRRVGETVNYAVPVDGGMHYLDRVETDWPFRIQLPIGTSVPFHCTGTGKAFLASLPPRKREKMVAALTLTEMTPQTLTHPDALLQELAQIREQGYSLDREEFMEGMIAIAVPVRAPDGRFIAGLAFHAPSQRMSINDALARKDHLQDAARRLSSTLFGEI